MLKIVSFIFIKLLALIATFWFSPNQIYLLFIVNALSAILIFYVILKEDTQWSAISILLLDIFIPVLGLFTFGIFLVLKTFYGWFFKSKYLEYDELPVPEDHYQTYMEDNDAKLIVDNKLKLDTEMKDKFEQRSYYEILKGKDKRVKISTIDILKDIKNGQAVELLQSFLDDDFYEVRYFANNTLETIEKSYYDSIESISKKIDKDSTTDTLFVERGFAYLDLCESKLLDPESKKFFYEKALYDFIFALALNPINERAYLKVVHIYLNLGDQDNVIEMCERVLAMNVSDRCKDKIRFYQIEAYYNKRNFKAIRELIPVIKEENVRFDILNPVFTFWSQT